MRTTMHMNLARRRSHRTNGSRPHRAGRTLRLGEVERRNVLTAALLAVALLLSCLLASSAAATIRAPGWTTDLVAAPTNFSVDDNATCLLQVEGEVPEPLCDAYQFDITNAGAKETDGSSITITQTLPEGVTVRKIDLFSSGFPGAELASVAGCGGASVVTCVLPSELLSTVAPDGTLQLIVYVTVNGGASGSLPTTASVSGGGALDASISRENHISSTPPPFGPANFNFYIDGLDGARDSQAGDHPYELTTTIDLNSTIATGKQEKPIVSSVRDLKDVVVDLPLGFVGSTIAAPECTLSQLSSEALCPPDTVVGHLRTEPEGTEAANSPIWNLTPEHGVPAEFGYRDQHKNTHVFYVRVAPTPAGYVLRVTNPEIPQVILSHIVVTFYGEPAKRDGTGNANIPFFTNPTGCASGPLTATIHMDSWQDPGRFNLDGTPDFTDPNWVGSESVSPPVAGCNLLQFAPELKAQPTTNQADTPSGLEFELKLPQTEDAGVHATPALKNAVVTLPEGMTVDPSAGSGLAACSVAQIGWEGGSPFNFSPAAPECPEASRIGSLELTTPLIRGVLTGSIYLATQDENPFGSTLAGYVVVDDPVTGVLLKIAGELKADPHTGRITGVFAENPRLPFSDLKLHFFGGPRAELATPESCGIFTTTSDLTPWSAPDSGPDSTPFDSFPINSGCVSGFAPTFAGGTTNLQGGAFTPFVASFSRSDTDQELGGLSLSLPSGLLAKIAGVPLCADADASAGTCPDATQIGTVLAGAGPGPNSLFVGGRAYLTGPYKGGPYGISVVVPAIAGPFNFGTVVVRQSLRIDPTDAHVTDVSDPFPTILDVTGANKQTVGIPIRLRRVDVNIDRPNFAFNPTNCSKLQLGGDLTSTQGIVSSLAVPFQVTNCATLKFAPKFTVSTSGKTSKASGASLAVKLSYPNGAFGSQANIAKAKVELPKQLPSRLTTLQKACIARVFETNPANCPTPSVVGHAQVITPLLPAPLTGPAYLVSHGGEAFPSLTIVLQGNGVTVNLVGTTLIRKGITSTTFKATPDVPFNTFALTLPQGPFSVLAANANLCTSKLAMPTEFIAQNGAEIHQVTKIAVTGCAKTKTLTRSQRLAKALKACHRKKNHGRRAACERQARKRYAVRHGAKKSKKAKR